MSRPFFGSIADALASFLPPELRGFAHTTTAANLKVWYEPERREHYEVQLIGRAALRAAKLDVDPPALEVGFHAEHREAAHNDAALERLSQRERAWRRALGRRPAAADFVGRPSPWRRISELWPRVDTDDGTAVEAAERLAAYIAALEPIRRT